jgi:hypothetical protein
MYERCFVAISIGRVFRNKCNMLQNIQPQRLPLPTVCWHSRSQNMYPLLLYETGSSSLCSQWLVIKDYPDPPPPISQLNTLFIKDVLLHDFHTPSEARVAQSILCLTTDWTSGVLFPAETNDFPSRPEVSKLWGTPQGALLVLWGRKSFVWATYIFWMN